MKQRPYKPLFVALLLACGADPDATGMNDSKTGGTSEGSTGSDSATGEASGAPTTAADTEDCILGDDGCACVEGLCLGDLACHDGVCGVAEANESSTGEFNTTDTGTDTTSPECGGVINGTVAIMNTLQLDQLSGVQKITGGLSIAANLGTIPQLACLEEVKSLTLSSGNDYSALQALRTLESLAVWGGPETVFPPAFTEVQQIDRIELVYVDAILGFPQVDQLGSLSLTSAPAPTFAETFALESLFMNEEQKDTSGLDGVVVQRFSVSGYAGTSLPLVSVEQSLDIYQAPNLTALSVELPPTFPAQAPENYDDEGNSRLYIHGTALTSLDELTGISVYTTRPGFVQNPNLVDVSGLTGAAVMLAYELPPNTGGGLGISESPQLCLSHAQMVIDTMTLPKPAQFYALDEDC